MVTVTVEDAQVHLPESIDLYQPGKALIITRNEKPVARLTSQEPQQRKARKALSAKGQLLIVKDDDEHLADFA